MAHGWYMEVLACPSCGASLEFDSERFRCRECEFHSTDQRDLRPIQARSMAVELPRLGIGSPEGKLHEIDTSRPEVTYAGPLAMRDSRELISAIGRYLPATARVLDLGCGPKDQKAPFEHLGHRYVGVDYSSAEADLLADAHALPFGDAAFDCVFSYAVLEHLHNPFVAIREVERVLVDGGVYVGTVSLGEPFHQSYFHHTAWGFLSLLSTSVRLRAVRLWAANDALRALARMGRYSRLIRKILAGLDVLNRRLPILTPRKMRWPRKEREIDAIHRAGSIAFVVVKEGTKNVEPFAEIRNELGVGTLDGDR